VISSEGSPAVSTVCYGGKIICARVYVGVMDAESGDYEK